MCLEDAAVLSELLPRQTRPSGLRNLISTYEHLGIDRCEKVQNLARVYGEVFSTKDPEMIAQRNGMWKAAYENRHNPAKADVNAPMGSPPFGE